MKRIEVVDALPFLAPLSILEPNRDYGRINSNRTFIVI